MKIGVLGLGSIGRRHFVNLANMGHHVMGYDPDKTRMRFDGWNMEWTREEVIAEAEALVIASPTSEHYRDLMTCLPLRKPLFCEKPLGCTKAQWFELNRYPRTKDVFIGYNLRFHPCIKMAKEWLDAGAIGTPLYASFVCGQYNNKYTDPLILNWSHEIDLARLLLGEPRVVSAWSSQTSATIMMEYAGGLARSATHLNYITGPQVRGFEIVGTEGGIRVDLANLKFEVASRADPRDVHWFPRSGWDRSYDDQMQAFVCFAQGEPNIGATGEDGLAVMKLCLDAMEMAKS